MEIVLLLIGLVLGAVLGWLAARSRGAVVESEARLLRERLAVADSAAGRRDDVAVTVAPLREALGKVEVHLRELERARVSAYSSLSEQVGFMRTTGEALLDETSSLVNALRAPQARGRWGEMQLRRVVELAGMVEHCDFTEQAGVAADHGMLRPDLVVRLAGGKQVVVDAKVSLAAYLDAAESRDPDVVEGRMLAHARHLREHVRGLAAKEYWRSFEPTPEFVVLFLPSEAFFSVAMEYDPALYEHAFEQKVIICTPTTLVALLKAVAFGWRQESIAQNAQEISDLGKELYDRIRTLGEHWVSVGNHLGQSVKAYNNAVGSLEKRVLPSARRFQSLGAGSTKLVPELDAIEFSPIALSTSEMLLPLLASGDA